jgi:hypothetical protein
MVYSAGKPTISEECKMTYGDGFELLAPSGEGQRMDEPERLDLLEFRLQDEEDDDDDDDELEGLEEDDDLDDDDDWDDLDDDEDEEMEEDE